MGADQVCRNFRMLAVLDPLYFIILLYYIIIILCVRARVRACARACACARCPKSFICWAGRWPVRRRLQCGAIRRSREPTPRLTIKISYIMMCCINKIDHVASYILIHHTSITALARSREEHYISYYDISYIIYHISLYHISICVSALLLAHGRISRLSI